MTAIPSSVVLCLQDANASTMSVEAGKVEVDDVQKRTQRQTAEERRLAEMMIPKKKRRLYNKIMYSKKKQGQEVCIALYLIYLNI